MTSQTKKIFEASSYRQFPDEPLLLLDFGFEKRQEEYHTTTIAEQNCCKYLFIYTFHGKGICQKEGDICPLLPHTAYLSLLPEKSSYHTVEDEETDEWEYFYVYFQGTAALPFYQRIHEDFGQTLPLSPESAPVLIWQNLYEDLERGRQLLPYEGGELVYRFLSCLLRTLEIATVPFYPPPQQSYVKQGISYMQNHLADNFSIENLAEILGVSSSYFNRLFVKEMGMTPLGYLNNLRISHAAFLLSDTLLSVDEVAKKCGFSCGNYFCKVFRRALGYSPSEFRRRSENLDQEKDLKGATPLC